ncbi:zf-B_box domain-containing protein/CCT domain-containing protein, partial [Cephalotus follicularis]
MGIEIESLKEGISCGWRVAAKPCDTCKSAAAAVFCRADSAFLCMNCDSRIHCVNKQASRHERVWMCEVCEQAPAAVTCKADAAALCVTCDADIHSANPLAGRHERVPVEPFFDSTESLMKSSQFNFLAPSNNNGGNSDFNGVNRDDVEEPGTWLLPPQNQHVHQHHQNLHSKQTMECNIPTEIKTGDLLFSEMDQLLDFDYQNSLQHHYSAGTDSVVPVQPKISAPVPVINNENSFDSDFVRGNNKISFKLSHQTQSLSQSVSSSSLEVGVVPDWTPMSDISYPFGRNMNGGTDPSVTITNRATQLCGVDREARVLRYREKRKNRKFEKTIRYASRKAYAETRPRIKGRFAKRTDMETEEDRLYNSPFVAVFMADTQYGIVPSF